MVAEIDVQKDLKCYHCGQPCDETLRLGDKDFCCQGCRTVYEILNENQLSDYYTLDRNPGVQRKQVDQETYAYLDDPEIRKKVLEFDSENLSKVSLRIPAIHCVSCIWLLEHLTKIEKGILRSEVNFGQKKVTIDFNPKKIKLSGVARLVSSLGYVPEISLDAEEVKHRKVDRSLVLKVAIAGFCFGNVMLFSFPEYLGMDPSEEVARTFPWLNIALSIPVLLYSGWDYLRSAAKSFKQRQINIDVPIAVGLLALFFRSCYDIITATGPGYLDSFTGLVFFLLIGRWFQSKTYESLSFDRDYTAYFPLAVNRLEEGVWKPVVIYKLKRKDVISVRNMEIVPADCTLLDSLVAIDYSFVTGESKPVDVRQGELVYAGGRVIGTPVRLIVEKKTSQSHLTSLWNNEAFRKADASKFQKMIDRAARIFTWAVLALAIVTGIYWQLTDPSKTWLVLTAVLMVACPCALALTAPFTFGNMLRVFGRHHLYLKNADVVERMATVDAVVFDKTGTITHGHTPEIVFHGDLSDEEYAAIKTLTAYSTHPLSKLVTNHIAGPTARDVGNFREIPGQGIEGTVDAHHYKIGAPAFAGAEERVAHDASHVFVSIGGTPRGYFAVKTSIRENISEMLQQLGPKCKAMLSGDHDGDLPKMKQLFGKRVQLLFNQSPHDKLAYIKRLQSEEKKVMMVGDGLNDAGALRQSDVGIAVTEDSGIFTPASDGILYASRLPMLNTFLKLAKSSSRILKTGFAISFFYNTIALSFAVTGHLTPLIAAILMPISSISVVGFSTVAVNVIARRTIGKSVHESETSVSPGSSEQK